MNNLQNKKKRDYSECEIARLEESLSDYWDKSRNSESETIKDLEKHLWLANGAALIATIGFIQARIIVPYWQYAGAWAFGVGILMLIILKYLSALNSSRDRYRFQDAKSRFDANEVTDYVFRTIRDTRFRILKNSYLILQWGAGFAFITGAVFTLIGVGCAV